MINGEIVLDTESLVIGGRREPEEPVDMEGVEVVEETGMTKRVNSATHGRKKQSARWTKIETEKFYEASRIITALVRFLLTGWTRHWLSLAPTSKWCVICCLAGREPRSAQNSIVKNESTRKRSRITWLAKSKRLVSFAVVQQNFGWQSDYCSHRFTKIAGSYWRAVCWSTRRIRVTRSTWKRIETETNKALQHVNIVIPTMTDDGSWRHGFHMLLLVKPFCIKECSMCLL